MNQDMMVKVFWDKCCVTEWVVTDILNDHSAITFRVKHSSWPIWFWKWRHYDSLKHWKLPTQQHSVTPIRFQSCEKHISQLKNVLAVLHIWLMKNTNYRISWISHNAKRIDINPELLEHSLQWKFWKMYFCTKRKLLLPYINKRTVCKEIFIMAWSLHWNYTAFLKFMTI